MMSFDEAFALMAARIAPLGSETIAFAGAAGRFLAQPLHARADAPRCNVSAMDGYAVRLADAARENLLRVVGEARPGAGFDGSVGSGEAIRIFTGAPVPEGSDCVIMQEYALREGELVHFRTGHGLARHIRLRGSDFREGDLLLETGTRLIPRALVAAAAADRNEILVHRQPRVCIIATGDELAAPGTAHLSPHAIPESVSYAVAAIAQDMGALRIECHHGADRLDLLERMAGEALDGADCVVVTGGASVGDHDFSRSMFAPHGIEEIFARIAIKPGKPVWLGMAKGVPVIGLPGNPGSALVTARLFLRPLLAVLQGADPYAQLGFQPHILAQALPENGDRETFMRAVATPQGLVPVQNQESGAQTPLAASDWLIRRVPFAAPASAGERVMALGF